MNEKDDIKKQLEVKNKEIYLNKLNLDVDNNLEVLVLAIDNLLTTLSHELTLKVIDIAESFRDKKEMEEDIKVFMNDYREILMKLLDDKKSFLQNNLVIEDDLELTRKNLDSNYQKLKSELETSSKEIIIKLENNLQKYLDTNFKIDRLKKYLENIFLLNLNNKVLEIIKGRDIILINTFKETYLKYLELNKNTVGIN